MAAQQDITCSRIVVVYESEALFRGVHVFLSGAPGVQIVGTERDARNAVEATQRLEANVVILEESGADDARELLASLLALPAVQRIVTLSLGSLDGRVYESRPFRADEPTALIAAVRGDR